jgi:hypothetical protein
MWPNFTVTLEGHIRQVWLYNTAGIPISDIFAGMPDIGVTTDIYEEMSWDVL